MEEVVQIKEGEPAPVTDKVPDPATPVATEPEPTPFEFTVEGQVKTVDGVYRIPGEGMVVPEEQVPMVQRMFAQAVTLDRQVREATQRANDLERLTEWKTTVDGKESVLTGREAMQALHVNSGTIAAALKTVSSIFAQPPTELLAQDEAGNIVWNPKAVEQLKLRSDLAERDARDAVSTRFASLAKPATHSTPAAPTVDLRSAAPAIIRQTAQNAGVDLAALTPEDGNVIAGMLARFQRPATVEDQALNPALKVGEMVIDPSFADYLKDRVSLRKNAAKVAQVATDASKFNKGMQPVKPAPKPVVPKPAPLVGRGAPKEKAQSANDIWSGLVTEAQSVVGTGRV